MFLIHVIGSTNGYYRQQLFRKVKKVAYFKQYMLFLLSDPSLKLTGDTMANHRTILHVASLLVVFSCILRFPSLDLPICTARVQLLCIRFHWGALSH